MNTHCPTCGLLWKKHSEVSHVCTELRQVRSHRDLLSKHLGKSRRDALMYHEMVLRLENEVRELQRKVEDYDRIFEIKFKKETK